MQIKPILLMVTIALFMTSCDSSKKNSEDIQLDIVSHTKD